MGMHVGNLDGIHMLSSLATKNIQATNHQAKANSDSFKKEHIYSITNCVYIS